MRAAFISSSESASAHYHQLCRRQPFKRVDIARQEPFKEDLLLTLHPPTPQGLSPLITHGLIDTPRRCEGANTLT